MSQRFELAVLVLFLSATAMLLVGCAGGSGMKPPSPLSVSVSKSAATVDVGTTLQLSATVANDSTHAGVAWTLSGPGSLSNQTSTSATYTGPGSTGSATVTATAVADKSKSASAVVTVVALPVVTSPAQIPLVNVGQPYSLQLAVTGGTPPFTWSVAQRQLPKGLSLDSSTGLISGTAQSAAAASGTLAVDAASGTTTVTATVQAADSSTPSQTSTVSLNFEVNGNASVLGFVYVAGFAGISEFSIGSDGALTLLRPQPGARSPCCFNSVLVVDALHRFVYGLGLTDPEILQYKIAADGTLSEMNPLTVSLGGISVTPTGMVIAPIGGFVYVSSDRGVHQFSVGSDGQLRQLGSPVAPPNSASIAAHCIAVNPAFNPSSPFLLTCQGQGLTSYNVNMDGTLAFLGTSRTLSDLAPMGPLAFDDAGGHKNPSLPRPMRRGAHPGGRDVAGRLRRHLSAQHAGQRGGSAHLGHHGPLRRRFVIVTAGDHLDTYTIKNGVVNPTAFSIGPSDATTKFLDVTVGDGVAYAVALDFIPPPPGNGVEKDHLFIYDLRASGGNVDTPEKRPTGVGPGRVLVLGTSTQTGPPFPGPLLYVTNFGDNNVAECGPPSIAPNCLTVRIAPGDKNPTGITGFIGSPGK